MLTQLQILFAASSKYFWATFNGTAHRLSDHMLICRNHLLAHNYENNNAAELDLELKSYVHLMAKATLSHFESVVHNDGESGIRPAEMHSDIQIYKVCRWMNPIYVRSTAAIDFQSIRGDIADLGQFDDEAMVFMQDEWSKYIAKCLEIPVEEMDGTWEGKMNKSQKFWKFNWVDIPYLSRLARYSFTITSSSAAAKRVFSTLKNSISLTQMHAALEDLTTITVMCQYNHRNVVSSV